MTRRYNEALKKLKDKDAEINELKAQVSILDREANRLKHLIPGADEEGRVAYLIRYTDDNNNSRVEAYSFDFDTEGGRLMFQLYNKEGQIIFIAPMIGIQSIEQEQVSYLSGRKVMFELPGGSVGVSYERK